MHASNVQSSCCRIAYYACDTNRRLDMTVSRRHDSVFRVTKYSLHGQIQGQDQDGRRPAHAHIVVGPVLPSKVRLL